MPADLLWEVYWYIKQAEVRLNIFVKSEKRKAPQLCSKLLRRKRGGLLCQRDTRVSGETALQQGSLSSVFASRERNKVVG